MAQAGDCHARGMSAEADVPPGSREGWQCWDHAAPLPRPCPVPPASTCPTQCPLVPRRAALAHQGPRAQLGPRYDIGIGIAMSHLAEESGALPDLGAGRRVTFWAGGRDISGWPPPGCNWPHGRHRDVTMTVVAGGRGGGTDAGTLHRAIQGNLAQASG